MRDDCDWDCDTRKARCVGTLPPFISCCPPFGTLDIVSTLKCSIPIFINLGKWSRSCRALTRQASCQSFCSREALGSISRFKKVSPHKWTCFSLSSGMQRKSFSVVFDFVEVSKDFVTTAPIRVTILASCHPLLKVVRLKTLFSQHKSKHQSMSITMYSVNNFSRWVHERKAAEMK